ncbi:YceI family protein [Rubrivirga sp.]|uniref:YceI family protein n=1 Tax=Rubrivirga sp. TaxID=1885344 RepID=UPI003C766F00
MTRTLLIGALAIGLAACGSEADTTAVATDGDVQTAGTLVDAPDIASGTYTIDASHSRMEFKVRHLGISTVSGTFQDVAGTVTVGDGIGSLQATATIDASTISTDNDDRDDHLRSPDFFDVAQYPEITFQSTELRAGADGDYVLVGDLTMHGVTRPVELDVEYVGTATSPQGVDKVAFTAEGEINRTDWGLTWNAALEAGGVVVSEEVELELDVQADLQAADAIEDASAEA